MSTKLAPVPANTRLVVDGKPADREWNRLSDNVREVFNTVVKAVDARTRWKGKHQYRRLLGAMAKVRRGETWFGECTDYGADMWVQMTASRRAAFQKGESPKNLFSTVALPSSEEDIASVRPLSQPVLPKEKAAVAAGQDYFVLWESPRNHQPLLLPEIPAPGTFSLH